MVTYTVDKDHEDRQATKNNVTAESGSICTPIFNSITGGIQLAPIRLDPRSTPRCDDAETTPYFQPGKAAHQCQSGAQNFAVGCQQSEQKAEAAMD
jgi:hypothetical protein